MWSLFLVYDEGILISRRHALTVRRETCLSVSHPDNPP